MPTTVTRLSQSADAARAAALQAEFNEKKWVWVPDEREGYIAGWVIREVDEVGEVVMAAGGEASSWTARKSDALLTSICAI
jgi:hypothetical protein